MRALGLDVGDKRIGVAMSDPMGILASPLTVLRRTSRSADVAAIAELVRQHEAERIVVGLPRSLSGDLGPQARRVMAFADALAGSTLVPVELWDERLSTIAAQRELMASGVRAEARRELVDAVAAAYILQGYLDRQRAGPSAAEEVR